MTGPGAGGPGGRVLVLAPTARDAEVTRRILADDGLDPFVCADLAHVVAEVGAGCGAALLTEEAILADRSGSLVAALAAQPPWSDLPLVVLTPAGPESDRAGRALEAVGHMTLARRPVAIRALVSLIRAALRDRARQYAARDHLAEREAQAEALRQRDERLRASFADASVGMTLADLSGRFLEANRAFCSLTGHPEGELRRLDIADVLHPDDRARGLALLGRLLDGEVPRFEVERRYLRKGGGSAWARDSVAAVRDAEGRPAGILTLTEDVSGRKRAEAERRESEERYRMLAENVQQLFWTCLPDGRCDYLSHQWVDYTGIPEADQLGLAWADRVIHPDDRDRAVRAWMAAVEDRGDYDLEYRIRRADGAYRWFKTRGTPIRDGRGAIVQWFGTCTDIDSQVRAEEATRRQAAQLRGLAEVGARVSVAHDVRSVLGIVAEEARRLIGSDRAAIGLDGAAWHGPALTSVADAPGPRASTPADAPPAADAPGLPALVRSARRPVRLGPEVLRDLREAGRAGTGAGGPPPRRGWLAAPLIGRDGRDLGLIELSDKDDGDFTEDDESLVVQLAQMAAVAVENAGLYQELREKDRRKDEFLAMLAHELRNPLAAIGNAVQVTTRSGSGDGAAWSTEVIGRQVRNLSRLIDDLLDVSRITRGKIRLRRERIDADAAIRGAVESARPLIADRGHELSVDSGPGLWLDADPTRLEQVVANLLNNAAKYTEGRGHIGLSARREGGEVVIRVVDDGVGIPPDSLARMFELFAQADRSLARSEGGLGIGLTLVRSLAEMHGGSVVARSEGPGLGSEFVVRLPAAEGGPPPAAMAPGGPAGRPEADGRASRVLVVDDNVDTARGMARLLGLLGHDVTVVHTGPDALEAARRCAPEYVLLDIGLPGMDGYEVASRLRLEDGTRGATIVAVSGYGQDDDRRRSKRAGFDHHLVKPIDPDALLTLLAR